MTVTPSAKTKTARFDEALIDVLTDMQVEMVNYGQTGAVGRFDIAELESRLDAADHDCAEACTGPMRHIVDELHRRIEDARKRGGSLDLAARSAANNIASVFVALAATRTDPRLRVATDTARAALADAQTARAEVLTQLEAAVASADLDAVLRLRPQAEVALPTRVDRARLDLLDAELAAARDLENVTAAITETVNARRSAAVLAWQQAQAALDAATARSATVGAIAMTAQQSHGQSTNETQRLETERAALLDTTQNAEQERFRRLAGLPALHAVTA